VEVERREYNVEMATDGYLSIYDVFAERLSGGLERAAAGAGANRDES
jgi:hypothetical protein